jgi:hypothetical protein
MQLNRVSERSCPPNIIAVAINDENDNPHCGIVYTDAGGDVRLCDMQFEHRLGVRSPPARYYWAKVCLAVEEVLQIAVFVELIIEQHNKNRRLPYSFLHAPDGFDATGRIRDGVGVTCATFVANIFEHFQLSLVDLETWKQRPRQDLAFRERIIDAAVKERKLELARRLAAERASFRLKPWEVYGSATHSRHPVKFCQAVKLARIVSQLVRRKTTS